MTNFDFAMPFDAAVIGAGIGGACAALSLARRGHRVALLEAGDFPRHKVCGEFLSPDALQVLRRLGLEEPLAALSPLGVERARIVPSRGPAQDFALPPGARALTRYKLDLLLWNACRAAGVEGFAQTRVRGVERAGEVFCISTARGEVTARSVVAAPGRGAAWLGREQSEGAEEPGSRGDVPPALPRSPAPRLPRSTARFAGFKTYFRAPKVEPGVVELHFFRGGYCGVLRVENDLVNVCLLTDYDRLNRRSPADFWRELLAQSSNLAWRFGGLRSTMPWLATANVGFDHQASHEDGVLRCGDASGYIHPLTGDGMAMAARGGELAGAVLSAALRGDISHDEAATLYARAWNYEFGSRLKWAARVQPLFLIPAQSRPAFRLLRRAPLIGRLAFALTRG